MPSMSAPRCRCASKMSAPSGSSRLSSSSHTATSACARSSASCTRLSLVRVPRVPDVVMYADTFRSPELRHEVPLGIPDPFLYVEKDARRHIMIGSMEIPRLAELGLFELHAPEEYGYDELLGSGKTRFEIGEELRLRTLRALG